MAAIIVIDGTGNLKGQTLNIPSQINMAIRIFKRLMEDRYFWKVNFADLLGDDRMEIMIIDFSCRCARSIMMGIPIFLDGKRMNGPGYREEDIDVVTRTITNYLEVGEGDSLHIVRDDKEELRLEFRTIMQPFFVTDHFANA